MVFPLQERLADLPQEPVDFGLLPERPFDIESARSLAIVCQDITDANRLLADLPKFPNRPPCLTREALLRSWKEGYRPTGIVTNSPDLARHLRVDKEYRRHILSATRGESARTLADQGFSGDLDTADRATVD